MRRNNNVRCAMMINIINNKPLAKFCLAVMWYRKPQQEGNRSQEKKPLQRHSQGGGECMYEAVRFDSNAWRSDHVRQSSDQGEGDPLLVRQESTLPKIRSGFYGFVLVGVCYNFVCLSQYSFSAKVIVGGKLISRREKSSIPPLAESQ